MRSILRNKFFRQQTSRLYILLLLPTTPDVHTLRNLGFEKDKDAMEWSKSNVLCHIHTQGSVEHPMPRWLPDVVLCAEVQTMEETKVIGNDGDDLLARMSQAKMAPETDELFFLYPEAATLHLRGQGSMEKAFEVCETLSLIWGENL